VVLYAWALCVIGGGVMQKASEHWQQLVTPGTRVVPEVAFVVLVVCAFVGGALVLAGIGAALPALTGFLLAGGWPQLRRTVRPAAALAVALAAATAGLALWSRGLSDGQRNGDDALYAAAFLAWVVLAAACLIAWTAAAVRLARRLRLTAAALRAEAWLAAGVTAAMAAVTAATVTWWIAVAGTQAAPLASELGVATGLMAVATLAGAAGTRHAHRALRAL
jgi:hypothetical protein